VRPTTTTTSVIPTTTTTSVIPTTTTTSVIPTTTTTVQPTTSTTTTAYVVRYVDSEVTSSGNGVSWATAFKTIQEAIAAPDVVDGNEIWVKKGTYLLSSQIVVNKAVSLYGGFVGTETQRDCQTNETIVDGNNATRCFSIKANATVDSFTITRGYNNSEVGQGGGVYSSGASVTIRNCKIIGNSAHGFATFGGGITNVGGLDLSNCVITQNTALKTFVAWGGGISNYGYDEYGELVDNPVMHVKNCTIGGNSAVDAGGGIYNGGVLTVINSIIWGNGVEISNNKTCTVSYSDVQGGYAGTGNINADPLFVNTAGGDYHLQTNSPCIDAGTSDDAPTTDFSCIARCDNPNKPNSGGGQYPYYDMGAYESPCTDSDGDGVPDEEDNCPNKPNGPDLGTCSSTSDKPGGNCTSDADCANGCSSNGLCIKDQRDTDSDGFGDVCDICDGNGAADTDNDGYCDLEDNCPNNCNANQLDADSDGIGDVCDTTPGCGGCGLPQCEQQC
jgi:hypothetical protein